MYSTTEPLRTLRNTQSYLNQDQSTASIFFVIHCARFRLLLVQFLTMTSRANSRIPFVVALTFAAILIGANTIPFQKTSAQTPRPILISHEDSTRAISFESVTKQREPFSPTALVKFGPDNQTRIMLFVMNLTLQSGDTVDSITVEAEDAAHRTFPVTSRIHRQRSGSCLGHRADCATQSGNKRRGRRAGAC